MDRPHFIIDGYNFIFRQIGLRSSDDDALWDAREELIHQMVAFLGQKRLHITIVFDGQDVRGIAQKRRQAGISVLFSKAPQKADPLILDIIRKSNTARNITLVTSDGPLANLARGFGCQTMSVEDFVQKRARKEQKMAYNEKYDVHMSRKELAEWLRLFEQDDEDE